MPTPTRMKIVISPTLTPYGLNRDAPTLSQLRKL